jgi:hypothetical protein
MLAFVLCLSAAQGLYELLDSVFLSLLIAALIEYSYPSPGFCKAGEDAWHWYIIASYTLPGNMNGLSKSAFVYISSTLFLFISHIYACFF